MTLPVGSTVAHTIGVAVFGYSLYYDLLYVYPPRSLIAENQEFKALTRWPGKWKYLTVWNIVLQLIYHLVALLNDLLGSTELNKNRQTFLQKLRDAYFASWVFPTGMFVCGAFWGLHCIDKGLIDAPDYIPDWLNHVLHTAPAGTLVLESLLFPHSSQNMVVTFGALLFGIFVYLSWIIWVNQVSNVWPYPILAVLGTVERYIFITAAAVVILLFYFLGEALNKWRWGAVAGSSTEKRKKKSK